VSINENFVVKNGFEVSTDLILADADTRRVGIGTTIPQYDFTVSGGIGATNFYLTGIGTFVSELNVGLGGTVLTVLGLGNSIGIGTTLPQYLLDIRSPVSTGQTSVYIQGDLEVTGDIRADDIFYDDANIQDLTVTDTLIVNAVSAFNSNVFITAPLNSSGGAIFQNISASSGIITNLNVTELTTLGGYVDINNSVDVAVDLNVVGLSTFGDYVDINDSVDVAVDLNVVGLTTLGGYVDINNSVDISNNLNVSGISTFNGYVDINNSVDISNNLNVVGLTTIGGYVDINDSVDISDNLNVSGISTLTQLNVNEIDALDILSEEGTFSNLEVTGTLSVPGGGSLDALRLRSYGISNDPTLYSGTGSIVSSKLRVSGISTAKFAVGEKVKLFGVTLSSDAISIANVPGGCSFAKVGSTTSGTTYRYWLAQYDYNSGKVGSSTQITPNEGVTMTTLGNFNDLDHIALTIARTETTSGILVYRSEDSTNISNAKLIAILGPKELGGGTSGISWKDYGPYERTEWSSKTAKNEFDEDQIHFPNTATEDTKKGWAIDSIVSIGASFIEVNNNYTLNTTSIVKLVHDNTYAFTEAINASVSDDINALILPGGTYLVQSINIPTGFTLKGDGRSTIIKQQYFANDLTDGGGNALGFNGKLLNVSGTPSNITLQNLTIDGNNANNILFDGELDNYLVYLENISSSLISDIEIRNSPGNGLYVYNSERLSLQGSSFIDGGLTDRYPFYPINAQESEVLRVNNCLFENYSGSVDISVTSIASINGNIIRNAGTGLRLYASSKVNTSNNIILGPSDEFVPTPDIYDSDFNSVNITVQKNINFTSPVFLYLENGLAKNLSSSQVSITAGIGTIINVGLSSESLGTKFLDFNIPTADAGIFGRENGYVQLTLNSGQTNTLEIGNILGYEIIGTEFLSIPVGLTDSVGISSGTWNTIGAGATNYTVTLSDFNQFSGISIGDIVKLQNHSVTPDLSSTELTVESKTVINSATKTLTLVLPSPVTSVTDGNSSGTINIKNTFIIAKGRVGVI
jgi:hypothetical protein